MPRGLRRFQHSKQSHFVTFSCYRRLPLFSSSEFFDGFVRCLEEMRRRFEARIYGYVVMPEHVHLLMSEPEVLALAEAIHFLKLSFAKRIGGLRSARQSGSQVSAPNTRTPCDEKRGWGANLGHEAPDSFWQKRYHDRNVRDYREFKAKLRYLHRNPVKPGLVRKPEE
jgi:putative transposase